MAHKTYLPPGSTQKKLAEPCASGHSEYISEPHTQAHKSPPPSAHILVGRSPGDRGPEWGRSGGSDAQERKTYGTGRGGGSGVRQG